MTNSKKTKPQKTEKAEAVTTKTVVNPPKAKKPAKEKAPSIQEQLKQAKLELEVKQQAFDELMQTAQAYESLIKQLEKEKKFFMVKADKLEQRGFWARVFNYDETGVKYD